jgi:hypothetical protein
MFVFRPRYFLLAFLLFVVEVLIALYMRDPFVRPYVGDYLVVILLYCALRSLIRIHAWPAAIGVLLFAYLIEALQYFRLVHRLGLEDHSLARTVIGIGFEWADMLAYTLGFATIVIGERLSFGRKPKPTNE